MRRIARDSRPADGVPVVTLCLRVAGRPACRRDDLLTGSYLAEYDPEGCDATDRTAGRSIRPPR